LIIKPGDRGSGEIKVVLGVIIINVLISVSCLYLAAKLWKLGKKIDKAANAILRADRGTYNVLHKAPGAIVKGEKGTRTVRKQYQKLQGQVQTLRQLIAVLAFLSKFTGRSPVKIRR
jgi:hypothetical protein